MWKLGIRPELGPTPRCWGSPNLVCNLRSGCSTLLHIVKTQHYSKDLRNSGWVTTRVAAEALGVKPRQVRNYISEGLLEARTKGEDTNRRYLVSLASVEALRDERRQKEVKLPGQNGESTEVPVTPELDAAAMLRELTTELGEARYQLGRAEARLELAVAAESTLREQLQRERERAQRLEADRDRLFPDLLREKDRANAERERAEEFEAQLREALEAHRGWFRRFFGF